MDHTQKEKAFSNSSSSSESEDKNRQSAREAQSHHKLEEIDLELNFNNAEIIDGPETGR